MHEPGRIAYRIAAGIALLAVFLLVWMNAAAGIIGDPEDGSANLPSLMYLGALGVGFVGALAARFRPRGMALAALVTAIALMSIPVVTLIALKPLVAREPHGAVGMFGLNAFFALLFTGSAHLFRRSASNRQHGNAT